MNAKQTLPGSPKSTASFRVLLALAGCAILAELFLLWLVPYLATRYQLQLERAETIQIDYYRFLREHESLRMIPPVTGVKYRRQVAVELQPESQRLFTQLLGLDNAARLHLLQDKKKVNEETFLGVLDHCYDGGASESQLEEFLVRAVAQKKLPYAEDAVYAKLWDNYYRTAAKSQYAGLINDARRLYRRFVELVRILNRDSPGDVEVHRALNRANVRLKILAPEHAFETQAMRKIQTGSAAVMKSFLTHPDARLAGLARFNAASVLWHANDEREEAVRLLAGNLPACGTLAIECKFLLAKILNSLADTDQSEDEEIPMSPEAKALAQKAKSLLDELTRELPDGHPLLDDIYFHRAIVAEHRRDSAGALVELRKLRSRCPNTDRLSDVKFLEDRLSAGPTSKERRHE